MTRYSYFNFHLGKIVSGDVLDFEEWLGQSGVSPYDENVQALYDAYRNWSILSPEDQFAINVKNAPAHTLTDRVLGAAATAVISAAGGAAGAALARAAARQGPFVPARPIRRVPLPARVRRQTPGDFKRRLSTIVAQRLRLGTRRRFIPL